MHPQQGFPFPPAGGFLRPFDVIRPAIDVFLAVWAVEHAYQLVLWVLRKVPILGIK